MLVWLGWLRIWVILGVIGVILLIEGDVTARIIGSVMVLFVLVTMIFPARHCIASPSP